jgi:hypothetical protein
MTRVRLIGIVALCVAALSLGCAKKTAPVTRVDPPSPVIEEPPPPPPPPPPAAVAPAPLVATLTEEEIFARKTLAELNAERPLGDAFFDLDAYSLREDARAVLQKNAKWLRRWPSTRITIEGHCGCSRHERVQPGARRPSRDHRQGIPRQSWYRTRSGARDEQGRRIAPLHGANRELLAAEPTRPFDHHGEVMRRA